MHRIPILFLLALSVSLPLHVAAEEGVVTVGALSIDPWLELGADALPALTVTGDRGAVTAIELTLAGEEPRSIAPPSAPSEAEASSPRTPWVVTTGDLALDPFGLPPAGLSARWRALRLDGSVVSEGEVTLAMQSAEASLSALEAEILATADPLARASLLERAALLALDVGLPSRADPHLIALRKLAPSLAARDAAATRRTSITGAILAARVQRTYADADPVHRRASLDRIERLQKAVEEDPELSAQCAILLAEAALERMQTSAGAERRKLLDRARKLARGARQGERSVATTIAAELLWVEVAVARGWRTESEETLDRLVSRDPRIVARVAEQRAHVAAIGGKSEIVALEVARAVAAAEKVRRHAGSLAVDAGLARIYRASYRAAIGLAARGGDGLATWHAIEVLRPREPGTELTPAGLTAMVEEWGEKVTLLACADAGDALVTVRANATAIEVHVAPTTPGAIRERVRALLRARGSDPAAADWLSERILTPHEGKLGPQVVIAPIGTLRPVPFDLLKVGHRVLGDAFVTWTVPAASAIRAAPVREISDGPVIAFVDPAIDYDGDGTSDRDRLPSTRTEADPWREIAGGYASYQGSVATEGRFRVEGSLARLLHLGCHGEHARHRPWASELLLAPGEGEDGRLSATELAAADLSGCALVCLSGCETGLSRAEGGDDLAGFPRAVLEAGAGAFLGSLWPVDDGTAGLFFRNFHDALRKSGNPRVALRQARKESRLDPDRRAPRHWAAWVLLENFSDSTDTLERGE